MIGFKKRGTNDTRTAISRPARAELMAAASKHYSNGSQYICPFSRNLF
jgi:hypothetical protein